MEKVEDQPQEASNPMLELGWVKKRRLRRTRGFQGVPIGGGAMLRVEDQPQETPNLHIGVELGHKEWSKRDESISRCSHGRTSVVGPWRRWKTNPKKLPTTMMELGWVINRR